jgi:glycerol uptake facilitator-like aquaporin
MISMKPVLKRSKYVVALWAGQMLVVAQALGRWCGAAAVLPMLPKRYHRVYQEEQYWFATAR